MISSSVILGFSVIPTEAEGSHPVIGVHQTIFARPQISGRASVLSCVPHTARDPSTGLGMTEGKS